MRFFVVSGKKKIKCSNQTDSILKTASITTAILILLIAFPLSNQASDLTPSNKRINSVVGAQANAVFNTGTNALEISMQSNGKPESILVYVSRSNGTIVHYEYITITSNTTILKIDLSDEGTGVYNLRLLGNSLEYSYAFKKTTP